jgi:hypothetical protein
MVEFGNVGMEVKDSDLREALLPFGQVVGNVKFVGLGKGGQRTTHAEVTMPCLVAGKAEVESLHSTCVGRGSTPFTATLKHKRAETRVLAAHVASFAGHVASSAAPADRQQSAGVENRGKHAQDEGGATAVDAAQGIGEQRDAPLRLMQTVNGGGERRQDGGGGGGGGRGGGGSDAAAAAVQLKNAVKALRAAGVAVSARSEAEQDAACRAPEDVVVDVTVEQAPSSLLETWHILKSPL